MAFLEVNGIKKSFDKDLILKGIDFSLEKVYRQESGKTRGQNIYPLTCEGQATEACP